MGFNNTPKVIEWKLKYIAAFNQMERILKEQNEKAVQTDLTVAEKAVHTAGMFIQFDKDIRELKRDIQVLFRLITKEPEVLQSENKEYASALVDSIATKYSCRTGIHKMAIDELVKSYCIDREKILC